MPPAERVGKVGMGVDLDHRHLRRVRGQSRDHAVGDGVLAAERQQEAVSPAPRLALDGRQPLLDSTLAAGRWKDVDPRRLGEVDERFLVERLIWRLAARIAAGPPAVPRP